MKSKEDNEEVPGCKADELQCTIGCKGEEKQKEEGTFVGEKFKLKVTKKMIVLRSVLCAGFLVRNRSIMRLSKGKNYPEKSSLACRVLNCIDASFEHL